MNIKANDYKNSFFFLPHPRRPKGSKFIKPKQKLKQERKSRWQLIAEVIYGHCF